jgi:rubredoxin
MKELVRCRPCGFVMEADKLGDVCPACGLPRKVFEPYREKVSINRLFVLNLDLHPIAIHLSQAIVITIPILALLINLFDNFYPEILKPVLIFCIAIFPFTLILSFLTGVVDGLTRFKTLKTPLLNVKFIAGIVITVFSFALFIIAPIEDYQMWTIIIGFLCLATGIQLGLWGKKLIDVILPGTYPQKKGKKGKTANEEE